MYRLFDIDICSVRNLFFVIFACNLSSPVAWAQSKDETVLLLNSYHPQYPWTKALTDAISETLEGRVKSEHLHIDYLDGRFMLDDTAYRETLKGIIEAKYSKIDLDVIIASDDYAVNFLLEEGDKIFPQVPVVYVGVNFLSTELANRDNYAGIVEGMDIEGNINLILDTLPNTESIILLSDNSNFGQHISNLASDIISANRRAANHWLSKQWALSMTGRKAFAIGILDIDHFKRVNDEHGHDIGDKVLVHVAKRVQKVLRSNDKLYRWGGEEFVIYFDFVDPETLDKVGDRLLHAIRHTPIEPAGTITASLGIAISSDFESLETLLIRADAALYHVKENGRDNLLLVSVS